MQVTNCPQATFPGRRRITTGLQQGWVAELDPENPPRPSKDWSSGATGFKHYCNLSHKTSTFRSSGLKPGGGHSLINTERNYCILPVQVFSVVQASASQLTSLSYGISLSPDFFTFYLLNSFSKWQLCMLTPPLLPPERFVPFLEINPSRRKQD